MAKISAAQLKQLVEAAIFVADAPLNREQLLATVLEGLNVTNKSLNKVLGELALDYLPRGIQLVEVASGFRFQSMDSLSPWLGKLWTENAPKYSRAMLEILALIAYRQPITRGEIEDVRGVAVSSHIIKTLAEREWVKIVGHKEVPGRPALYATTKQFLNYFSLKSLADLPSIETFLDTKTDSVETQLESEVTNHKLNESDSLDEQDTNQPSQSDNANNQEQLH
jgi:segregation and condensation protein B